MNRTFLYAAAAASLLLTPACAQEQINTADKAEIENIVREYILENPEIIEEALIALNEKQQLAEAERVAELIAENADAIYNNPQDYSIGPADAPVTVVEFFDYRCGYCKRSAEWASQLPEKFDGQVRVVFKEYPILSAESEKAALAAIAAGEQGKYLEMHLALMALDNREGMDTDTINRVAEEAGIDVLKMRADMSSIAVQKTVADSKSLARKIGVSGTPNFLIGTDIVPGADTAAVERLITAALAES
ncbi:MAG: thioredoxin domain-containing protein [Henriciella sp.]|nr:thioredoxin domain-containing protein [Henriciella sp.]